MDPNSDAVAYADARRRRRLEREARRAQARRRLRIGLTLVLVAFISAFGVAYAYRAGRSPSASSPKKAKTAPLASATPTTDPLIAESSSTTGADIATAPVPSSVPERDLRPTPAAPKPPKPAAPKPRTASADTSVQRFSIGIGGAGYVPDTVRAKAGRRIVLTVGRGEGCAAGFNIPKIDVHKDNSKGPVTFSLGKLRAGSYVYTCGMGMVSGTLIVR